MPITEYLARNATYFKDDVALVEINPEIREARGVDRVPYMLILGEKEKEAGNISVRDRSNETVPSTIEDFIAAITAEIAERR